MANIAASDVTHLVLNARTLGDSRKLNRVRLSFGDGALTYPAGGVPISKAKLGCPTVIESMTIVDQGTSGYHFRYDQSAEKIVMIQTPAHAHDLLVVGGLTVDEAAGINASVKLGKSAATNRTVIGSAANGGVQLNAALAGTEPSAVTIAAQVLEVEVIGW